MLRPLIAALLFTAALWSQPQPRGGILGGVVRNAWSKAPIRRAMVTLSTTGNDPLVAVTYSEPNGAFAFGGVPPGEYYVCAELKVFARACYGANESGRPVPTLSLEPGQSRRDVVLSMLPLGSVSGTVTDANGEPAVNAMVQLVRPLYSRRSLHWAQVSNALSNDRGEYRLSFLQPGKYRVYAVRQGYAASAQSEVVNGQNAPKEVSPMRVYPNADSIADGATLSLNAGNDLKGIDFSLATVAEATVSGHVEPPPDVTPDERLNVMLMPANGLQAPQFAGGAGPPDYYFHLDFVPPGPYRLTVMRTNMSRTNMPRTNNDRSFGYSELVQAGSGTDNMLIHLTPGTPLAGSLKLEGAGGAEHGPYRVILVAGDEIPFFGERPTAEVKPDGSFRFESVLPGIWDIDVEPLPPGAYLKAMRLGQKDVLTDDMVLTAGEREPLNLVMSMNGAIVKGTVIQAPPETDSAPKMHAEPQPAGRARVLLAPDGPFDNTLSFYQLVESDANGQFAFKSVTPGRYRIYAFDHLDDDEYWNPDFLKPFVAAEEPFDIAEGARLDRKSTLIVRGPEGMR